MMSKTAVITGSGQGIGKGIALRMAKDGFNIVISDIDESKAEDVVKEIAETGGKAVSVKANVTSKADIHHLV